MSKTDVHTSPKYHKKVGGGVGWGKDNVFSLQTHDLCVCVCKICNDLEGEKLD